MIRIGVSGLTGMIGKTCSLFALSPEAGLSRELIAFTRRESDISFLNYNGIECRQIDYRNPDSFSGKLEDIDVFLHLAGLTKAVTPAGYYRANVDGTARLLEALSHFGKRIKHFIFVSSTSASGPADSPGRPKSEADPNNPVSHYGKSKLKAEALVRSCPFNWTIVRLPIVFGPHDYDMLTMFRIIRTGRIILFSRPEDPYTYVTAPDVARFLLQAMNNERLFGGIYCYCYDIPMPVAVFFPMVRKQLGLPETYRYLQVPPWVSYPIRFILDIKHRISGKATIVNPDKIVELATTYWVFPNEKLKSALGLKTIKNDRAVAETVQWYQKKQLL